MRGIVLEIGQLKWGRGVPSKRVGPADQSIIVVFPLIKSFTIILAWDLMMDKTRHWLLDYFFFLPEEEPFDSGYELSSLRRE